MAKNRSSDEICDVCNRGAPPGSKGKRKPKTITWIGCDACPRWFHPLCVRISDSQMEEIDDYQYFCESCAVRGCLIPKPQPVMTASGEVSELKKVIQELSAELTKLRAELDAARETNKKQLDRLRNVVNSNTRSEVTTTRLASDLSEKLEKIERGAQLANTCSQTINSCRLAINKIPFKVGENVRQLVADVLTLVGCSDEQASITDCFRVPAKPSKWSDRSLTPTIVAVFSSLEARQKVLRKYFERHKDAALRNLKHGPALDYRFTVNEVLSINTFRIRNHALRLKQRGAARSVFVRNDKVSVLLPGQVRYTPVNSVEHLQELVSSGSSSDSSSLFFDALSANVSASSRC